MAIAPDESHAAVSQPMLVWLARTGDKVRIGIAYSCWLNGVAVATAPDESRAAVSQPTLVWLARTGDKVRIGIADS
ncbi:hypothetical protein [Aeromonas hydrophila]|uniref:hypothetical protein n=1 Tax=Aeromonas hydrophila TaxID=644 RepID=UPI002B472263|nr:hypothetical protein [Aeromonas hydrophila]